MDDKDRLAMFNRLNLEEVERRIRAAPRVFICCICNISIMGTGKNDWPWEFSVDKLRERGKEKPLHVHGGKCLEKILKAANSGKWQDLPKDSGLRKVFERSIDRAKKQRQV